MHFNKQTKYSAPQAKIHLKYYNNGLHTINLDDIQAINNMKLNFGLTNMHMALQKGQ